MRVAHYPLSEDSGSTAYDYSGNGNDGTANGAGPSGTGTVDGPLGQSAYDFDGTDDYIDIPYRVSSNNSVSAWFNTNSGGALQVIVGVLDSGSSYWEFGLNNSGGYDYLTNDGSDHGMRSVSSYPTNEWVFLTGTFDGSTYRLYENGQEITTAADSTWHRPSVDDNIGARQDGNNVMDGAIADVRVYDHALSPPEIQYLYEVSQKGRLTTSVQIS